MIRLGSTLFCVLFCPVLCFPQEQNHQHLGHFGVGIKISSLGAGVEAAVPLFSHSTLRTGFNYFLYRRDLDDKGVGYRGELNLRSAQVSYDWYPFHGRFHFGPTALIYNGTHVHADLGVPGGRNFTVTQSTYVSDPSDPIRGTAVMKLAKVAPGFVLGWGSLLSGRHRHFSFPVELGLIYQGAPRVSLNLTGTGCDPSGRGCGALASDPSAVSDIHSQQEKLAREVTFLRFYPIISFGVGYRF